MTNGFIMLPRAMVQGETWRVLSPRAVKIFIAMWSLHNGKNNGRIRYSVRQAMADGQCCKRTAITKLRELQDASMIDAVERGGLRWAGDEIEARPTAWRIVPEPSRKHKAEGAK